MPNNYITASPCNDYVQSANALFHFMKESQYLKFILKNKAIVPRYCIENIEYLNIHIENTNFKKIAILQKCFCDLQLHKLTDNFELNGVGDKYEGLPNDEKLKLIKNNTRPDYYGKFGIAFSKSWGENSSLQPVHYLNEKSDYTLELTHLFESILNDTDIPERYADEILNRLCFIKPIRGTMIRKLKLGRLGEIDVEFCKNFHGEQEWRYVPSSKMLTALKMERIIANPNILEPYINIDNINDSIEKERFKKLWLEYDYDDIRYIIVPDSSSRIDIINTIMSIPDEQFDNKLQKYILISKILVLEEIRKDW